MLKIQTLFYLAVLCFISTVIRANDLDKAELAFKENQFFKSLQYFRIYIDEAKQRRLQYQEANATNRLCETLRILGKDKEAEQLLLKNEKFIIGLPQHTLSLSQCYDILGEIRYGISDIELAGVYFKKSLVLKKSLLKENDADLAFSYSNMGRYYNFTQQNDSAIFNTKVAYGIIEKSPVNHNYINFERIYCEYAYAKKEEPGKRCVSWYDSIVRSILNKALVYNHLHYKQGNYWLAMIYHNIGNTYSDELNMILTGYKITKGQKENFYKLALSNYAKAAGIYKVLLPERNPELSTIYFVTGLADKYYGTKPTLALKEYQKALQQIIPQTDTTNYFKLADYQIAPFNIHLYLSILSFKIDALDEVTKLGKKSFYNKAILYHTDNLIKSWDELIKSYRLNENKEITTYYFKLPYETALDACINLYNDSKNKEYLKKAFFYIEVSKYGAFLKQKLMNAASVGSFLKSINYQSLNLGRIQHNLKPDEAIWELYDDTNSVYSITILKNGINLNRLPISIMDIQSFASLSNANTLTYGQYKTIAYKAFLKFGLNSKIFNRIKSINVVPGISFSYRLPFSGLISTTKGNNFKELDYLVYKFRFHYSLSTLITQQTSGNYNSHGSFRVLYAAPSYLSSLPFSQKMVNKLDSMFNINITDNNAPLKEIMKTLDNANVVHIATHTIVDETNPDESYIALTNKKVFLTDVYKYPIRTNLLNLGSCETTIGKSDDHNGSVLNFVSAFTFAGANSITSTLWKVDDEMTSRIYLNFYSELSNKKNKATALNDAQITYIKKSDVEEANPYYWAGIVFYGNPQPIDIQDK